MSQNRINSPANGAPVIGQQPKLWPFTILLQTDGLQLQPIAEIQAPNVISAMLLFIAQTGGDVSRIIELRAVRKQSSIITPV